MLFKTKSSAPTVWPIGNTDKLPMELDISTSKAVSIKKILIGTFTAIFGAIASVALAAKTGSSIGLLPMALPLVVVAIGVVNFFIGVIGCTNRRIARFENGQVTIIGKSLLRSENWSEPLQSFDGVVRREYIGAGRQKDRSKRTMYEMLDLQHTNSALRVPLDITQTQGVDWGNPDTALRVPLDVATMRGVSRRKWEHFAKLLGVPAID